MYTNCWKTAYEFATKMQDSGHKMKFGKNGQMWLVSFVNGSPWK